jgi:hypothetical protein
MRCTSARDSGDEIQDAFARALFRMREHKLTIERERGFERHQWFAGNDPASERFIQAPRFGFPQAGADFDSSRAQLFEAAASHRRVRVRHCRHDARDACCNQRLRAWPGASRVAAGLQVDVKRCASRRFARSFESDDFRVAHAVISMKTFTHDAPAAYKDRAHQRVGACERVATRRQLERAVHEDSVSRERGRGTRGCGRVHLIK